MSFSLATYPPFIYMVTSLTYFLMPPTLQLAALSNVSFLAVLLVSTYKLTEHLVDRRAGVFAAFLVGLYPIVVATQRYYYLDFGLTAMVSLSLLLLLKSRQFQDGKVVLALAFGMLAGMLSKETFPFYVAPPFAYIFLKAYPNRRALLNAAASLAIASTSMLWYVLKPGGLAVI